MDRQEKCHDDVLAAAAGPFGRHDLTVITGDGVTVAVILRRALVRVRVGA